jgi:hypothetical protein
MSQNDLLGFPRACAKLRHLLTTRLKTSNACFAAICNDIPTMQRMSESDALMILKDVGRLRPTFLLYSAQGVGSVIPIVLDQMPESFNDQVSIARPLAHLIRSTPIQAYVFMTEVWATPRRRAVHPARQDDKFDMVLINVGLRDQLATTSYTITGSSADALRLHKLDCPIEFAPPNPCFENLFKL